jgi:glutaredoxin
VNQLEEVVLYVKKKRSLRCWRAKGLLARKGYYLKVIHTTNEELGELLMHLTQGRSDKRPPLPYVFIAHRPVGGFADIKSLERSGTLERLIRGEV